jgi:ribosomal subunit interface protein
VNVQITARHDRKVSEETRNFIEAEIEDLTKFYDKITSAQVVLDKQDHKDNSDDIVKIVLNINGGQVVGTSVAENMRKAFDDAEQKVVEQLKKQNDIKKSHNSKPIGEITGDMN